MRLTKLVLTNFRGIRKLSLDLSKSNTSVLIGVNGSGKSSVLDAAAIALTRITSHLGAPGGGNRHLQVHDINNNSNYAEIQISVKYEDSDYVWKLIRKGRRKSIERLISNLEAVKDLSSKLLEPFETNEQASFPLFVYYPINRAVLDIPLKIKTKHNFNQQLSAYDNALTSGANFRHFFEWFRDREDFENEIKVRTSKSYKDQALEAVRSAIYAFMENCTDLRIRRLPTRIVINKSGNEISINQMSDGEKCLLALIGDLARRFAIANPSLPNPLEGQGIVLVDEIELHMHPRWQRSIIPSLEKTFPNCQFILSTHSPQVLGEAQGASVFLLESAESDDGVIEPIEKTYGMDSNRILEEVMGAESRTSHVERKMNMLFAKIEKKEWVAAKILQSELEEILPSDDPDLLHANILAKKIMALGK